MEDGEILKTLSNELLKGAKMLSIHCPKCGYPLFEKDGKTYCPVCEKYKNDELEKNRIKYDSKEVIKKVDINRILIEKINYLAMKLKDENEIGRIKEISETLYMLLKIRKKIE
ncbi:MAG: Sjogren's syndrome/scleroderma autoantigen 1 family protein [Methanocaldococcus sp.]